MLGAAAVFGFSSHAVALPFGEKFSNIRSEQTQIFPRTDFGSKPVVTPEAPVLLEAQTIDYQHNNGLVIASGQVAITQGETILLADQVAYDQEGNLVIAQGNVSMLDPSGNVYFADEVELTGDLKTGTVKQFKARFNDNSLFAAAFAHKLDEHRTELFKGVYSPCFCRDDETKEPRRPQWSIKTKHALIDQEEQDVVYDDAYFNIYDVPVFYSPYFSHATPGADNRSGLLMPEYRHTENLGSVVKIPVYYSIAPDKDLTVTPINTSQEGLVLAGEYRQKFDSGSLFMDGSITRPSDRDAAGNISNGNQFRGHWNAGGDFTLNPDTKWGFDIHRTTDDTYLRRYNFSNDPLLISKMYLERFNFPSDNGRSFGSLTGLAFQGLTAQDNADRIPLVLPLAFFSYESDPWRYNSRFHLSGNALSLYRDIGSETRRLSTTAGWKIPYITEDGQIIEVNTQLRADIYSVEDVMLSNGEMYAGETGRLIPQVSALWRYPFINRWHDSSLLIEPVVMAALSPGGGNPEEIPNEDSVAPELTDSNLFDPNRFAGYDRVESGPRVSYGLRGQVQLFRDKYLDWLLGQSYRVNNDRNFPVSNSVVDHFSDYIGKVGLVYDPLTIAYRFRLDRDDWTPKRSETDLSYREYPFTLSLSYLSLQNDPVLSNKEAVTASAGVNLTEEWIWDISASKDLELNQLTTTSTGLTFRNECTSISAIMGREFTRDRDLKPSTAFLFRISLKNLE